MIEGMQVRFQVEPPSLERWKPKADGFGQLASKLPSSSCFGFRGLLTMGASVTMYPPSDACVGGSTHGVGEHVRSGFTDPAASANWPCAFPARKCPAERMTKINRTLPGTPCPQSCPPSQRLQH